MKTRLFLEKNNIYKYIETNQMIKKGDGIVLGLSGGPDSVCLLFVLLELSKTYDLTIKALHVNHGIRGAEADRDQHFVEGLCASLGIELVVKSFDVPGMSVKMGMSEEETGRILRYNAFAELAAALRKDMESVRIAVAHNADDNAETMIFNMTRGAGLSGIKGIAPVRGDIIRPLLCVSKKEILEFLSKNQISYVYDSTNSSETYSRNKIRKQLLPVMCEINEQALSHMSELAENIRSASAFIEGYTDELLNKARLEDGGLDTDILVEDNEYILGMALKKYISDFMPYKKDVSKKHVEAAMELLSGQGSQSIDLPFGRKLVREYKRLYVRVPDRASENEVNTSRQLDDKDLFKSFKWRIFDLEENAMYPQKIYTKWVDYDKIKGNISYRYRQKGDYVTINDQGGTKKLKDYFINEKIPKEKRDSLPLVCDGSHVVWVVGHRLGAAYRIDEHTKRVLEISYEGEKENE